MSSFGTLLRITRNDAGFSMGDLSRHLGVSVPEVCAVELENAPPFSPAQIGAIAKFLRVDPQPLLNAAAAPRPPEPSYPPLSDQRVDQLRREARTRILIPSSDVLRLLARLDDAEAQLAQLRTKTPMASGEAPVAAAASP